MRLSLRPKWIVAVLLVAILGIIWIQRQPDAGNAYPARASQYVAIDPEIDVRSSGSTPERDPSGKTESAAGDSPPCLTLAQLESHPSVVKESYRFDAAGDSGPSIAAYRGLTEQEIRNFADQGESAAMVVLGAMSVMRARGWPVEQAVPYLMFENPDLMEYEYSRPISRQVAGHMAKAREWYYKAALHGRVMVLSRVGQLLSDERGGAVGLGWIGASEYDGLSGDEQFALSPWFVYYVLSFEVAPALKTGPRGGSMSEVFPMGERRRVIVEQLADRFFGDLEDAGLDPASIPESEAPPIEDLVNVLCEGELDWLDTVVHDVR